MISAKEALTNHKKCVENLKRRDGEYFTKYMKIIEDKINEANEKYGCTYVCWKWDFCIPSPIRDALKEYLTELGYKAWVCTHYSITEFHLWWDQKSIEEVERYKKSTEKERVEE